MDILWKIKRFETTNQKMKRAQHDKTGTKSEATTHGFTTRLELHVLKGPVVEIFEMSLKPLSLSVKFPCSSSFDEKIKISDRFQLAKFPWFGGFHPDFWLIQRGLTQPDPISPWPGYVLTVRKVFISSNATPCGIAERAEGEGVDLTMKG